MVVADSAVPVQNFFNDLLPIYGVFQCQADIVIVVGGLVRAHGKQVMLFGSDADDLDFGIFFQQMQAFQIAFIHHIDHPGAQCIDAGVDIRDPQYFHLVKMSAVIFPVIGIFLGKRAHPRFKKLEGVRAGADEVGIVGCSGGTMSRDGKARIVGKSTFPWDSVTTSVYFPSAFISWTSARYALAWDLVPSWRWLARE